MECLEGALYHQLVIWWTSYIAPIFAALRQWFLGRVFFVVERSKIRFAAGMTRLRMSLRFTEVVSLWDFRLYQGKDMLLLIDYS